MWLDAERGSLCACVQYAATHSRERRAGQLAHAMRAYLQSSGQWDQLLANNQAYILLDMRTSDGTAHALGGEYPATSLYMMTSYVQSHHDIVQKLVNAYVKTLKYIQDHTGAQIADQMPADYYSGVGKDAYAKAFDNEKGIYNPTGIMPPNGPPTNLAVLSAFNKDVIGKNIDLSKTYTDQFVKAATS